MKTPEKKYKDLLDLAIEAEDNYNKAKIWQRKKKRKYFSQKERYLSTYLRLVNTKSNI